VSFVRAEVRKHVEQGLMQVCHVLDDHAAHPALHGFVDPYLERVVQLVCILGRPLGAVFFNLCPRLLKHLGCRVAPFVAKQSLKKIILHLRPERCGRGRMLGAIRLRLGNLYHVVEQWHRLRCLGLSGRICVEKLTYGF
jgi:hypothetical protein